MKEEATWYFDLISPYSYLQLPDLDRLPPGISVRAVPVLFAVLLNHSGAKGPAEIPAKRLHTYRQCAWLARARNLPFKMPPRHPFNPLAALRLLCSIGPSVEQARIASSFVFGQGGDPSALEGLKQLGAELGVDDPDARAADQAAKDRLRANTEQAMARGVWGVPTFLVRGELFWGADSFPMMLDYLEHRDLFETPEMKRLETLPVGASRA